MSGIAGLVSLDGSHPDPDHISRMTRHMHMRGPDGIFHWQHGPAAFGYCRLCTTSESLQEQQPLGNEDGSLLLVADVRVDNWRELRAELLAAGCLLRTESDAELVLRAFERWGEGCLAHIEGDYALVIWEAHSRRLFCARDRMGNKSLYWFRDSKRFVVATDMAAILALPGDWSVDTDVLHELVAGSWQIGSRTLWQGVLSLPPAHTAVLENDTVKVSRYWWPASDRILHCRDEREYVEAYRECFLRQVSRMSRSHLPVAVEVSGGLDSSAIHAAAGFLQRSGALQAPGFTGWSLDCSQDGDADEAAWVRALAEYGGTPIHEIPACIPDLGWFEASSKQWRDMPPYPNAASMDTLLARAAASGSRVVLNGLGGDEWLWGSRLYYREALQRRDRGMLATSWRADVQDYGWRAASYWLFRHGVFRSLPTALQNTVLRARAVLRAQHPVAQRSWLQPVLQVRASRHGREMPARAQRAGQEPLLAYLVDSMALWTRQACDREYAPHGLEPRSPMYSAEFLQFVFSLPEYMLMRGKRHKYVHREAMRGLLPDALRERLDKGEFSYLFRHQLAGLQTWFLQDLPREHPDWVVAEGLQTLVETALQRGNSAWPQWQLWNLYACHTFLSLNAAGGRASN